MAGFGAILRGKSSLTPPLPIAVPAIALDGDGDGVTRAGGARDHARHFKAAYERRVIPLVGHNLPQEAPREFAQAVLDVARR